MRYSLQCKYSMINQLFLFVIKSRDNSDYSFQWQIKNVDKPIWLLTNNNIVFKAELIDDLVQFSVVSSDEDIKAETIRTATVPILTFETDEQQLQIIYDFNQQPTYSKKIIAKILSQVIQAYGGGFLESNQQYDVLQNNIEKVLLQNNMLQQEVKKEKTAKKRSVKKVETKENIDTVVQVEPKKKVTRTRKTAKKEQK